MATAAATSTQQAPAQGRPHAIRYLNALNTHWRHELTPAEGETSKIGHHAASYLIAILSWADQRFLMDTLHGDGYLCLPNGMQKSITGFSVRQCQRIRQALQRHGLICVVPGTAGRGGKTSPQITVLFDRILYVRGPAQRQEMAEVGEQAHVMRPDRPDNEGLIRPDRPHMETGVSSESTAPRSFGANSGTQISSPPERSSFESESIPGSGPEVIKIGSAGGEAVREPSGCSSLDGEDVTLASPIVSVWLESSKCPPSRRRSTRWQRT